MRSNQPPQPDEARSSLEDSAYEVLGESLLEASDDEGNTESLASTTPDDVSSISDADEFDDDDDDFPNDHSQHLPDLPDQDTYQPNDTFTANAPSPNASMMTSMTETQSGEASFIKLEEKVTNGSNTDACGVVSKFSEARELPQILRSYGCPELRLTLRMALSERYLPVPRSYRILYVGEFPEWGVKEINARIGAALDATPSSSRFNIVQGPAYPGSTSSSNIQLERSGLELVVDHCMTPKILREADRPARALITLDDGTELTFGPGKAIRFKGESSSISLPDLVIFCHYTVSSDFDTEEETEKLLLARQGFMRHAIPCLDIATTRPYGKCPGSFAHDQHSLRLCMEGRKPNSQEYENQETLPIDIYAFCSIDPSELNRHLAFISPDSRRSELIDDRKTNEWLNSVFGNKSRSARTTFFKQPRIWLALLTLSAILSVYLSGLSAISVFSQNMSREETKAPRDIPTIPLSLPPTSQMTPAPQHLTIPEPPTVSQPTSRDLSILPSYDCHQHSRSRGGSSKEATSGGFEIEVKGPQQFIVRPTNQITKSKKKSQLDVQVLYKSEAVPIRVVSTQETGTYEVILEKQYPMGKFHVDLALRRKPILQQSFEVELGVPNSRIANLITSAQTAQENLKDWAEMCYEGVSEIGHGAIESFSQMNLLERVQHSTESVTGRLKVTKQEATRRLKIGSKVSKEVSTMLQKRYHDLSEHLHVDVWGFTSSIRKSMPLQRAHNNARIIRKKLRVNKKGKSGKRSKA